MKRLLRQFRHGQRGFTLIELLIVIAILGIIAAIVVPNVAGFMTSGILNAANTEVANVKTAAVGFLAENGKWPGSSNELGQFLEGTLKATYTFYNTEGKGGQIEKADLTVASGWAGKIYWDPLDQVWKRGDAPA